MKIILNGQEIETLDGETLLEAAKRMGYEIPALCYAKGAKHKSSCMVCAVKNLSNGQILPSCSTFPAKGMAIETDSDEVRQVRVLTLELLLSDHRADCEAPCSMVCPKGLDVEQLLSYYDAQEHEKAYQLLSASFALPEIACDTCKTPCEKACRRGSVDQPVSIREIIRQTAGMNGTCKMENAACKMQNDAAPILNSQFSILNSQLFYSRLGRFTSNEKERLKATVTPPSRCLHCACAGRAKCKLRAYASAEGIKRPRYEASSALPAIYKQPVGGNSWFEPSKCIRCGLCVYNSDNGFTFKDRGFDMSVVLPDENRLNINIELTDLCPTGALYVKN